MIRQRKNCPCWQERKSRHQQESDIKLPSLALHLPCPNQTAMEPRPLTGQQRHCLRFLKVKIALASVGDGSNLLSPYTVESMARMAPELWIKCKARGGFLQYSLIPGRRTLHKKRLPHPPARDPSRAKSLRRIAQILVPSRGETWLMWKSAGDDEPGPQS